MATGKVDVLRRRDYPKYSKREFEYYRNGLCDVKLSLGRNDGVEFRDEVRDSRRWRGLSKKRKFSPVIWDKEEKKVRVSSKNGVVPVSVIPRKRSSCEVHDVVSDRVVLEFPSDEVDVVQLPLEKKRKSPVTSDREEKRVRISSKNRVVDGSVEVSQLEAPADLHNPLHSEAQNNLEGEDQNSSDTDSPRDDVSCSSTLESDEIRREDSVGDRSRISSSHEESHPFSGNGGLGGNAGDDSEVDDDLPRIEEPAVPRGRSTNMLQGCRSVDEYTKLEGMLDEGAYGVVYRARDNQTGEIVAIKKVKMDKCDEGFPITSLREINILLSCNHPSIVDVKEVVVSDSGGIFMVMEHMEYELQLLMKAVEQPFRIGEVKYWMKSLLEGVKYLHDNWVLHRDLKTVNILLNKEGDLKICDFGLSRQYGSPLKPYTSGVVTLWYRAPELLLGQKQYSTTIDMWSVGCIMGELLAKKVLFEGEKEVEQLGKIFETLGIPNETDWPGVSKLPGFKGIQVKQVETLRQKFPETCFTGWPMLSASGLDLLTKLLTYDPEKRITVDDALSHDWFKEYPEPRPFKPSPNVHDRYMILMQRRRQQPVL